MVTIVTKKHDDEFMLVIDNRYTVIEIINFIIKECIKEIAFDIQCLEGDKSHAIKTSSPLAKVYEIDDEIGSLESKINKFKNLDIDTVKVYDGVINLMSDFYYYRIKSIIT